jgi:hypothetical protein
MPTAPAFATAATSSTVVTPGIDATWIGAVGTHELGESRLDHRPFAHGLVSAQDTLARAAPSEESNAPQAA